MPALPSSLLEPADSSGVYTELATRFLLALLEGRKRDALALVLAAAETGTSIPDLHQDVLARVQAEIGWMWQAGEIHAGEEHLGTRIIEEALVLLRARLPRRDPVGRSVLVASIEGNLHDIGARIVADRFELEGWTVHFLGANVPTPDLVRSVQDLSADVLALSVELGLSARATARAIDAVHANPGPRVPILVGGLLFDSVPGLWRTVGADAHAKDLREAVIAAERLVATAAT
jgi:methanogenic corrinoid protein MtbC1